MKSIATRVGPVKVTTQNLMAGRKVTTIVDTQDDTLFMNLIGMSFVDGIDWAIDYVKARYSLAFPI